MKQIHILINVKYVVNINKLFREEKIRNFDECFKKIVKDNCIKFIKNGKINNIF